MQYPKDCPVFESGPDLNCAGKHSIGELDAFDDLRLMCGCMRLPSVGVILDDIKPLTPAAEEMLAVAREAARGVR